MVVPKALRMAVTKVLQVLTPEIRRLWIQVQVQLHWLCKWKITPLSVIWTLAILATPTALTLSILKRQATPVAAST